MNQSSRLSPAGSLRARQTLVSAAVASTFLLLSFHANAQYVAVNSTGAAAQATGTDSVAVGSAATAAGSDSTAIGTKARVVPAADTGSMALGYGATIAPGGAATSSGNLAIGMNATVGGTVGGGDISNAIAIGTGALSERSGGISIGASSHNASAAIAIGNGANTGIDGQIAIGTNALADPSSFGTNGGVAIGQDSYTSGVGAALGVGAHASGNSVAAGANSFAGWRDTVIGVQATATGNESVAIGYQSNDGGRDQVVSVGTSGLTRAVTNVTAGTTTTDAANVGQLPGTISGNVVTMGNALTPGASAGPATVTNVAAGALSGGSTDAVNGSQLNTTNLAVTVNKQILDNLSGRVVNGTIGLVQQTGGAPGSGAITVGAQTGGSAVDFTGTDGARALSGVAAGTATTDAVNVGQLNAVASVAANSVQYDNAGHTSVTLGGAGATAPVALTNVAAGALSASSTDAVNGGQLFTTNEAVASTTAAVTNLSNGISAGTVGLVQQQGGAPGSGTITVGATTGGSAVDVTGTAGARQVKGVAAGVDTTDAVNVGQLNAVGAVAGNSVQYDDAMRTRVTLGGTAAGAPVALSNVAAGAVAASSTDAVNGSQLYTTNQAVAGNTTAISTLSTGISTGTVGLVQQQGGAPGNGTITVGATTGGSAVDVTGTAGARQLKGVAAGVDTTDAVNVGQLTAAVSNVADNAVMYDNAARSIVTLGGVGATVPVVLRNVAPATLSASSTDAVNGSQLYATNLAVTANTNAINALTNNLSDVKDGLVHAQQPVVQPTSVPDYLKYFAASSSGAAASASGTESVAAGGNSSASGPNSVAVGSGAQASGSGAVAIGANSSALGNGSVAVGQGSVASSDNTVSFGNSATGVTRTLANVSAGVAPTDAVNVKQLNDSMSGLRSQIEHDRADANGGTASAVAIASLPQAPAPGKSVVSVGGGTYAGQSALAVGLSTYAGRWILKASGSTNTRGTVAAGVGAGFVW